MRLFVMTALAVLLYPSGEPHLFEAGGVGKMGA